MDEGAKKSRAIWEQAIKHNLPVLEGEQTLLNREVILVAVGLNSEESEAALDLDEVLMLYEDAVRIDPRNVLAYYDLARNYLTKFRNLDKAELYCQRGYEVKEIPPEITKAPVWLNDIHEEVKADFDFLMMKIRLEQGRVGEARELLSNLESYFAKYSKGNYLVAKESFEKYAREEIEPTGTSPKAIAKSEVMNISNSTGDQPVQTNSNLEDLKDMRDALAKVAPAFKKGSILGKAILPVNYVLDKLKAVGFGVPWKAVTKIIPPIRIVDESIGRIQRSLDRLATPTQTLYQLLPSLVEGIQTRESSAGETPGLSGQLLATTKITSSLQGDLLDLNNLMNATGDAIHSVGNSMERLQSVKGIGSLAESLKESLSKLENHLLEAQAANRDLISTFQRTLKWLPSYQAGVRCVVTSSKSCQATVKSSFFKKEMCQSPVNWFDDEAAAICDQCRINICEQHRVEVLTPVDAAVRCIWLCIQHAKR